MPQSSYTVFGPVVTKTFSWPVAGHLLRQSNKHSWSKNHLSSDMTTIYRQFLFVLLCFSRKLCLRAFRPMNYIISFSGSVCYCLALKSKKWSIIYFKSDVKFFPWHIIRLNFITWFVCVFFVCFHVQINLKTVCILHKTMMTDSPITKSIGTWVFLPLFITCVAKRFCFCIWACGSQAG